MQHFRVLGAIGVAFLAMLGVPSRLLASTITFDSQPSVFSSSPHVITESGYSFSLTGGNNGLLGTNEFIPPGPDNGSPSKYLVSHAPGVTITLTHTGGLPFSLLGLDAAEGHAGLPHLWATGIRVTGYFAAGGSATVDLTLDGIQDGPGGNADFQSFLLPANFVGLSSVVFTPLGGSALSIYTADNFRLEVTSTIPEPATIIAFGAMALGAFGVRRRRMKATATA